MVVSFDDALKNAPGVDKLWTSTGRTNDGAGYFAIRGFSVQPTMVNGIAGLTNGGLDPANMERIETIKGPSGTLFGSSFISFCISQIQVKLPAVAKQGFTFCQLHEWISQCSAGYPATARVFRHL